MSTISTFTSRRTVMAIRSTVPGLPDYYSFGMHATIYRRGQMVIPAQARQEARINQGDIVSVEAVGDGKIVMVRLNSPKKHSGAKVTFTRRKGRHMVGSVKRKPI